MADEFDKLSEPRAAACAVSVRGVSINQSIGKLDIPDDYQDEIERQGSVELPISWTPATAAGRLPPIH